jgi:hypothetical protein
MNYQSFLRPFVERKAEPHTITADDACAALMDAFAEQEPWAIAVVHESVRARCLRNIKEQRQAPHKATFIDTKGRARAVNTALSRPIRDEDSGDVVAHQLVIEWDMDAAQLNAVLAHLSQSAVELRGRIQVARALLDALARHPKCKTAREAWTADGKALDSIDLRAAA